MPQQCPLGDLITVHPFCRAYFKAAAISLLGCRGTGFPFLAALRRLSYRSPSEIKKSSPNCEPPRLPGGALTLIVSGVRQTASSAPPDRTRRPSGANATLSTG